METQETKWTDIVNKKYKGGGKISKLTAAPALNDDESLEQTLDSNPFEILALYCQLFFHFLITSD